MGRQGREREWAGRVERERGTDRERGRVERERETEREREWVWVGRRE